MHVNEKSFVPYAKRWTIFTMIVGVIFSVNASLGVAHFNRQQAELAASAEAEAIADTVVSRIKLYEYGLRGARGAVQTMGESEISRERFDRYSRTRNLDVEFPGALGFGFIRRVARHDESRFLAQARVNGWPDFTISELAPHDSERFVIQYISEAQRNKHAVGLDIASEANRKQAALSAISNGEVRLTGPITLVQATGSPQQSFLILMPIYRGGVTPATVAAREAQAFGWSYAPLIIDEVLRDIWPREQAVGIELRDVTDPSHGVVFYKSANEKFQDGLLARTIEREVYGRRWQLQFEAYPPFVSELRQLSPWLVLGIGLLLSAFFASLIGVLSLSRARQKQIIAEQKKLAAIVESSADGIISMDVNGTVTSWNKAAEAMFGFSSDEAMGRQIVELLFPADLLAGESVILATIRKGEAVPGFNTLCQHKNQQLIPVSMTVSPTRDTNDELVAVSATVRDISRQIAAEEKIHELNNNLEAQVAERTVELRELNMLLSSVLDSASEVAIIATDRNGIIRVFNSGAERMLGYRADEMVGKSTPTVLHLDEEVAARSAELTALYGHAIEGFRVFVHKPELENAETREWTYVRKDGSPLPISLAVTAMRDDKGECTGYLGIAIDLTAQRASEIAVASARDQLLMAADAAELGIWSWDLADNSLSWNDRMFEIYGQPLSLRETGLDFEHWHSRLHPNDVELVVTMLNQAVAGEAVYEPTFVVVHPDGTERTVQAGAQVERDAKGAALRVTGINRDVTTQRELETRLREAKEQADATSAAKSSFLANMSHEIRTPMNAVLGMLRLVQNTKLTDSQLDYVCKAEIAAKSLLGLLNDILDYSKIEAGKLLLDAHAFDLESLMRDLAVVLSGNQGGKDVEVLFDLDPHLPRKLFGDSQRLQQVLINLAGNALKFTHHGQVVVRVQQHQRCGDKLQLRIEVTDTGIGISADELERIFEGFTQAEASTTRRFGGTGLGLVICKRLLKLMGSELQVSSKVGVGSRFWFDIDCGLVDTLLLRDSCPGADRPIRLLVADDNEMAGFLLVRMAEALGWQADLVQNGLQTLEQAQQMLHASKGYDVVLVKWRTLTKDGSDAARLIRLIRQQSPMPHTPVIAMTDYGREILSDAQQDGNAPFAGFLHKPITPLQLAETVHRVLEGGDKGKLSITGPRAGQLQRLAGLRLLVVEDNTLNRQVAFELLQREGANVTLAEGGIEGVRKATEYSEAFDAVLMDVQMPDIDGLEATRKIRLDAKRGAVKIIAMTANASIDEAQACLTAGMDDHLAKPIDLDEMVAKLQHHTARVSAEPVAEPHSESLDSIVESTESIYRRFGGAPRTDMRCT